MVGRATTDRTQLVSLFDGLPYQHFQCIHSDVPWTFESWSEAGEDRSAQAHYSCLPDHEIARLPVLKHAAADCHLFFWVTGPMLATGRHVRIMRGWGFEPTAMAFVWIKLNPSWHPCWLTYIDDAITFLGMGHTTRQNAEYCLLGRRGSPVRLSRSVRQIVMAPLREHSRKPEEVYNRVESYCRGPRLDLFGRQSRQGWTVIGDQATMFDA
jgi:N6-adenosine-specific RNA methylase IME4